MTPEEYQQFLASISTDARKRLFDIDKNIKEVQDKPPEFFFKKFKEGDPAFDAEMHQLDKYQFTASFLNDLDNYRHVLLSIWNALCRKHHDFMEASVQLKESKDEIHKFKS